MGYYDSEENIEEYLNMAEGYDGAFLIERLGKYLDAGSSLLELGMGPGVDLQLLDGIYRSTGSDSSEVFINRYRKINPDADLLLLDAVEINTDRYFDAVYSNKVLHHLEYSKMHESFIRQSEILNPDGIALHTFWYVSAVEEYEGLMFYQLTEDKLYELLPQAFEVLEMKRYSEMEKDDSLYAVLRLKRL